MPERLDELPSAVTSLPQPGQNWMRTPARLVSLAVSVVLLLSLYSSLDVRLVGETLRRTDKFWLLISVGMIVPITVCPRTGSPGCAPSCTVGCWRGAASHARLDRSQRVRPCQGR